MEVRFCRHIGHREQSQDIEICLRNHGQHGRNIHFHDDDFEAVGALKGGVPLSVAITVTVLVEGLLVCAGVQLMMPVVGMMVKP